MPARVHPPGTVHFRAVLCRHACCLTTRNGRLHSGRQLLRLRRCLSCRPSAPLNRRLNRLMLRPQRPQPQPAQAKGGRAKSPRLLVALVVLAVTGMGSLMLLASAMRSPSPESNAAAPVEAASAVAAVPGAVESQAAVESRVESQNGSAAAPRWVTSRNPRKAGFGANMVFELAADGDVEVWRKRVRPVLTVRCAARATEVFVVTEAPATHRRQLEPAHDQDELRRQ